MHEGQNPSVWVKRCSELLRPESSVLDLACGSGRHARYFADQGHDVTALDKNPEALSKISSLPRIHTVEYDLEMAPWPFADRTYDAILVTNYLYRPILENIVDTLSPSGILIYETFMLGNERFGRPSNPDFLLRPNELIDVTYKKLHILIYEAGRISSPKPALVQRVCAVSGNSDYSEVAFLDE
ncbi:MAG: class I SAM-dependent methyltransferase [Burkholderiales bacterium]